jgi:hypothetical protein
MDKLSEITGEKVKTENHNKRFIVLSFFALLVTLLLAAPQSFSQNAKTLKANDEAYREYMVTISRQLGVTCNACHNQNNFTSNEKVPFRIAKEHIRLTQMLIDSGMNGVKCEPKADCYMCHRGQLKPNYKEPIDPMTMNKTKAKKPTTTESDE